MWCWKIKKILKNEISKNKKNAKILNLIEFPEFIKNDKDLYYQEQKSKSGNYITTKISHGEIVYIKNIKNFNALHNGVFENADPGYDFIFPIILKV